MTNHKVCDRLVLHSVLSYRQNYTWEPFNIGRAMRIKDLAFPALVITLVLGACGGSEPPPPPAPTGPTQAELDAARADSIARVRAEEARQREA